MQSGEIKAESIKNMRTQLFHYEKIGNGRFKTASNSVNIGVRKNLIYILMKTYIIDL